MPKQKDLKRKVRTRMQKTGESYTTARLRLLEKKRTAPKIDHAALAGMSDDAVRERTGRTWSEWTAVLDAIDAASKPHGEIARHLHEAHGVPGWWSQMVTVGYERIRGLREVGQRRSGSYEASKSKTFAVPLGRLYDACADARQRSRWLGGAKPVLRTARPEKSVRLTWEDGTSVELYFTAKGEERSQVAIQHRKLPSKVEATRLKQYWAERLAALGELLPVKLRRKA